LTTVRTQNIQVRVQFSDYRQKFEIESKHFSFTAISIFSWYKDVVLLIDLTPVAGLFFWVLGFEQIFQTQGIFKKQKSALLVLWKGVINPPIQSVVNQYFSQRGKYWLNKFAKLFSEKNHEK